MAHPAFIIEKTKDGQFRFNLTQRNGQVILSSESYTTKWGCLNGVESVKRHAPNDGRYERKEAKNGQLFFNLRSSNHQVIGTSEMYGSKGGMENGIKHVKTYALIAEVDDRTLSPKDLKKESYQLRAEKAIKEAVAPRPESEKAEPKPSTGVVTLVPLPSGLSLSGEPEVWVRLRVDSWMSEGESKVFVCSRDNTQLARLLVAPEDIFIEKPE